MGYVEGLGLQNPELKILFQLDIRLLRYSMSKSGKSATLATTFFLFSSFLSKSSCQYGGYLYMHKTENKSLQKDEMSYGGETWYMGRIYEELKNYACVWLISICIIN